MKKLNIKIVVSLILLLCGHESYSQTVSYTYKPLAAEGCSVTYTVARQDTAYYIMATIQSDRLIFMKESTMLVKNFDNEILELNGILINNGSESMGIVLNNTVIPVTSINSTALFSIIPEQFKFFRKGISKIKMSTIPIEHERTFKKDKIGKKLYQFFLRQKNKYSNF